MYTAESMFRVILLSLKNNMIFRIDDIGASAKHFEQHGQKWFKIFGKKIIYFPFANFWFFKRVWPFKRWAKYDELIAEEWMVFLDIFDKNNIVPIIAITATWVDENSNLIPFPEKFPEEARILKTAFLSGKIVVANHGLTHCVVGKHMPRFFSSNRKFHREFLPELNQSLHTEHILKSQEILEKFFEKPIEILVPPGNMWSHKTYSALSGTNIKKVMCNTYMLDSKESMQGIEFIKDNENVFAFHDRELKLYGKEWLINKIQTLVKR